MTLIKSILLGTAAGMAVVSGAAQAADLPTKKAAPAADYVKICNVNGMAGFIIPGSDTCLKISGFVLGLYSGGNLKDSYTPSVVRTGAAGVVGSTAQLGLDKVGTSTRDSFGMGARGALSIDTASNTAYGPLVTSTQFRGRYASGNIAGTGNGFALDHAYIQWAGITAGFKGSFFDVFGEGYLWDDYYSPDNINNNPALLAYTATFGGGFSATLSLEDTTAARTNATTYLFPEASRNGPILVSGGSVYHGVQYPDVVGVLDFKQAWGEAAIAAAAHDDNIAIGYYGGSNNHWGWALNGGVKFNLPQMSGDPHNPDALTVQAQWTKGALGFSGLAAGNVLQNGNGTLFLATDNVEYAPGAWTQPTAWSAGGSFIHYFSPQFSIAPEISYLDIDYGSSPLNFSTHITSWKGGAIATWIPVPGLDFSLELMYTDTHETIPGNWNYLLTNTATGVTRTFALNPVAWQGNSNGFIGRLHIERDF